MLHIVKDVKVAVDGVCLGGGGIVREGGGAGLFLIQGTHRLATHNSAEYNPTYGCQRQSLTDERRLMLHKMLGAWMGQVFGGGGGGGAQGGGGGAVGGCAS